MAKTRIYRVNDGEAPVADRLVEATSAAQAIRYCVIKRYKATVPNTKEVAELMALGIRVEQADAADPELDL